MDPMPGFELTEPWLTENGLPVKGLFEMFYYSGQIMMMMMMMM
jgi:hypothetical protein